jgi:hypothetical protein
MAAKKVTDTIFGLGCGGHQRLKVPSKKVDKIVKKHYNYCIKRGFFTHIFQEGAG